ncbi:MAG: UDP-N-acetylmuramoyl-L-alanyl-D-glutamate--2,6-diaminopimelate ligase [Pseudomonadales bacterium]|nr:UDP-N-acetylmuramoyl-L-alanyl-D-glutamate--2,6-diaminopimelate ligase [Pseudomonadales bacterium]
MSSTPVAVKSMPLKALLPDTGLTASQSDIAIKGVSSDSRKLGRGDLFLAYPGFSRDGRDFIDEAVNQQVAAIVYEQRGFEAVDRGSVLPFIGLENLQQQSSAIASRFYGEPSKQMEMIAITGTNGKTSCCYWLSALLESLGCCVGQIGTLGVRLGSDEIKAASGMTTPDSIEVQKLLASFLAKGARCTVMEVSSHALDQGRVNAVDFDIAIFTNLGRDHLDYHGDEKAYKRAKARLFSSFELQTAIINIDDVFGEELIEKSLRAKNTVTYSLCNNDATVYLSDIRFDRKGSACLVHSPWGDVRIKVPFMGAYNLANLMAVVCAASSMGFDFYEIVSRLEDLPMPPGRMQIVSDEDVTVIVDYAHTPDALEHALNTVRSHSDGVIWCVFGCGGDRDTGKRALMGAVAARLADRVVLTSDNPRSEDPQSIISDIVSGIPTGKYICEPDRYKAIEEVLLRANSGDVILIAGKGHENYQEVNGVRKAFDDVAVASEMLKHRARRA